MTLNIKANYLKWRYYTLFYRDKWYSNQTTNDKGILHQVPNSQSFINIKVTLNFKISLNFSRASPYCNFTPNTADLILTLNDQHNYTNTVKVQILENSGFVLYPEYDPGFPKIKSPLPLIRPSLDFFFFFFCIHLDLFPNLTTCSFFLAILT